MATSEEHPIDNDNLVDNDSEEDLFDDIAEQHMQSSYELKVVDRFDVVCHRNIASCYFYWMKYIVFLAPAGLTKLSKLLECPNLT